MLDHVDEHGGQATTGVARRRVRPEDATTPAEELLSRGLLVPRDDGLVVLPGEVALVLRGGRTTREPVDVVPAVATSASLPGRRLRPWIAAGIRRCVRRAS